MPEFVEQKQSRGGGKAVKQIFEVGEKCFFKSQEMSLLFEANTHFVMEYLSLTALLEIGRLRLRTRMPGFCLRIRISIFGNESVIG